MTRRALSLVTIAFGLLALAGCADPPNAPTEFDAQVQENFVAVCTGDWEGSETTLAPRDTCTCAYEVLVERYEGDFEAFAQLDQDLRSDQSAFPADLEAEMSSRCPGWGGSGGREQVTPGSVPGPVPVPATGTTVDG